MLISSLSRFLLLFVIEMWRSYCQGCFKDFNVSTCIACDSSSFSPNGIFLVSKSSCQTKNSSLVFSKLILIVNPNETTTFSTTQFDAISNDFASALRSFSMQANSFSSSNLTFLFTTSNHNVTLNSNEESFLAGISSLQLTLASLDCISNPSCNKFPQLQLANERIHFIVPQMMVIQNLEIVAATVSTLSCSPLNCQILPLFIIENEIGLFSSLNITNSIIRDFSLVDNFNSRNALFAFGNSNAKLILNGVSIKNVSCDGILYSESSGFLFRILSFLFPSTNFDFSAPSISTPALQLSVDSSNFSQINTSPSPNYTLFNSNRTLFLHPFGLFELSNVSTAVSFFNISVTNSSSIHQNLKLLNFSRISSFTLTNSSFFNMNHGMLMADLNSKISIGGSQFRNSAINGVFSQKSRNTQLILLNSIFDSIIFLSNAFSQSANSSINLTQIQFSSCRQLTILSKDSQIVLQSLNISNGVQNSDGFLLQSSNDNVNLAKIIVSGFSTSTASPSLFYIFSSNSLIMKDIIVSNARLFEVFKIFFYSGKFAPNNIQVNGLTPSQDVSSIFSRLSEILDFSLSNSSFTNHSAVTFYSSNNNAVSKNISLANVSFSDSNITNGLSLLMWHLKANTSFTNCSFSNLLVKDPQNPPQPNLDLFFFFGAAPFSALNCSFLSLGYFTWRGYYVYSGTDYSILNFWTTPSVSFLNCTFVVDDSKLNHHFISFIAVPTLISIANCNFLSKKTFKADIQHRGAYGLNINFPKTLFLLNNTFSNLFCYCFPDWSSYPITSYAAIYIFYSSSVTDLIQGTMANIESNQFIDIHCNNNGGSLAILNYFNVSINNNIFRNSSANSGAFLYLMSLDTLQISNNTFTNGNGQIYSFFFNTIRQLQFSKNSIYESFAIQNSPYCILSQNINFLYIMSLSLLQNQYYTQSKVALIIDSSKYLKFENSTINGSVSFSEVGSSMIISKTNEIFINGSFVVKTQNNKFYSIFLDSVNSINILNSTVRDNLQNIFSFNDFYSISIQNLQILNNAEVNADDVIFYLDSQNAGNIAIDQLNMSSNSYSQGSAFQILAYSDVNFTNLTILSHLGQLFFVYLYLPINLRIISANISGITSKNYMIYGETLNIYLFDVTLMNYLIGKPVFYLRNSILNMTKLRMKSIGSDVQQTNLTYIFYIHQSQGFFQFDLVEAINSESFIYMDAFSYCNLHDSVLGLETLSGKFLETMSAKNDIINITFLNSSKTIFDFKLSNTSIFNSSFLGTVYSNQSLIAAGNLYSFIIRNSFFMNQYKYSIENIFLENLSMINVSFNGSSFGSAAYIQYISDFDLNDVKIINYNLSLSQFSVFMVLNTKNMRINNTIISKNFIYDKNLMYLYSIGNFVINNSLITENNLTHLQNDFGNTLFYIECDNICFNHSIVNSNLSFNVAPFSIPNFISNFNLSLFSTVMNNNIGFEGFDFFIFQSNKIDFEVLGQNYLFSGLPNQLTLRIFYIDNSKTIIFDNYSTSSIQNFNSSVVIRENYFVQNSINGELIFQNLILSAQPNSNISLTFQISLRTNSFYQSYSLVNQVIKLSKSINFYISFCQSGQIYKPSDSSCNVCPINTYSTFDKNGKLPVSCQVCPLNAICLGSDKVIPKSGFWKAFGNSSLIIQCENSKACSNNNKIQNCLTGYEGILCFFCSSNYGKSLSTNDCISCNMSDSTFNTLITCFYLIIFSIYTIILSGMGIKKRESVSDSILCLLNIIITHYQYFSIISAGLKKSKEVNTITFGMSDSLSYLFNLINPNLCLINSINQLSQNSQVILIMSIFYFLFILLIFLPISFYLLLIFTLKNSKKLPEYKSNKRLFLLTICFFVLNFFYPNLLSININKLSCLNIDNYSSRSVLKDWPNIECFKSDHFFILNVLAIPGMFILGFFIPITIYYLLKKQVKLDIEVKKDVYKGLIFDKRLNEIKVQIKVSTKNVYERNQTSSSDEKYLPNDFEKISVSRYEIVNFIVKNKILKFYSKGYKNQFCWWEVHKIFLKVLISFVVNLGYIISFQYIRILLFFFFMFYLKKIITNQPYLQHLCQKIDILSMSLCILFCVSTSQQDNQSDFSFFIIIQIIGNTLLILCFLYVMVILISLLLKEKYLNEFKSSFKETNEHQKERVSQGNIQPNLFHKTSTRGSKSKSFKITQKFEFKTITDIDIIRK